MTSTMTPSERRRAYKLKRKLKRIVVSEHNYLALKRLGQAGNSFNDVINNLLQIHKNYQEENEEKQKQKSQRLRQQRHHQESKDDKNQIQNTRNEPYSQSWLEEIVKQEDRRMEMLKQDLGE